MTERARPRRLSVRLALWICLTTAVSLTVFGVAAYVVVTLEEEAEAESGAEEDTAADVRNEVLISMALSAPVGLILAGAAAFWLTRRALAPVDRAIAATAEVTAERLDCRLPVPERDDELRALVLALNGLLQRLECGYQSLSLFAADASHELRTPLAVIGNELEVALRRPRTPAEWEEAARTSLDEVRRLSRLVDALLRLTRADVAGSATSQRLELLAVLDQALSGQAAAADRAGVTLVGPAAGSPAALDGDANALLSAFTNLVGNAIRYSPRGGTVTVRLEPGPAGAMVVIEDAGAGIDDGELVTIFEPFVRGIQGRAADGGGADEPPGLGLGLPIARRIIERHGGRISAENRAEGGARFRVDLPLAAERA